MADGESVESGEKELTAKQRKNRKKREAAKRKKQEQRQESGEMVDRETLTALQNDEVKSQETSQDKFHRELNWCIEQLEMGLAFEKPGKKQAEVVHRHLRSLKSSKTPLPRKRQLMFSMFGDYRQKMKEDQKKQGQDTTRIKPKLAVVKNEDHKSIFIKVCQTKAADLNAQKDKDPSGESSCQFQKSDNKFKFNFGNNAESA